jgi:hypothetical protein
MFYQLEKHCVNLYVHYFNYKKNVQLRERRINVPNIVFKHFLLFTEGKMVYFKSLGRAQHCYVATPRYIGTQYSPFDRKIHSQKRQFDTFPLHTKL